METDFRQEGALTGGLLLFIMDLMLSEPTIRLVAVDVDGTLVGPHSEVAEPVREALSRARQRGCEVVICTGRSRATTVPIWEQIPASPWMIVLGGAVVLNHLTEELLYRATLSLADVEPAVRLIRRAGLGPMAFNDGISGSGAIVETLSPPWPRWAELNSWRLEWVTDLTRDLHFPPVVISAMGPPETVATLAGQLQAELKERIEVTVSVSWRYQASCVEVRPLRANKGYALRLAAEHLGIPRESVMAIGDYLNDLDMIEYAGWGVAMGDSPPELKERADAVTGTFSEHGVAQAVERWILKGS